MRIATLVLAVAAGAASLSLGVALAGKDEPKACVKFAKSWDKAVEEAKALNVPLVIHNHGVY